MVLVPKVLIVDDEAPVREFLAEALREVCGDPSMAASFGEALRAFDKAQFDVILADICMPGCTGMDLLQTAKRFRWDCAVILMTGHASLEAVASSVRWEASDFLLKPFSVDNVIQSVSSSYQKLVERREALRSRAELSLGLRQRTIQLEDARQSLSNAYRSALASMVSTLAARESGTYAHSYRVRAYSLHLATLIGYPDEGLSRLAYAALLHDIGKIAVPDAVLLKPARLTPGEFKHLQLHTAMGEQIVQRLGFLPEEAKIIRHHHERWDGNGYPDGLRKQEIPLGSRLFAVADTLDAMTSDRCYRQSLTVADAQNEIRTCAGSQFDPTIAAAFADVSFETWSQLREEAEAQAMAAAVPEFSEYSPLALAPGLVELFPVTLEQ